MTSVPERRKVLALKGEPSIRKLCNLMSQVERQNTVKGVGKTTLAGIHPERFDVAIVDLRFRQQQIKDEVHGVGAIRPSVIGKMLVVTLEVNGPKTAALVERYLLNRLAQPLLWLICNR